MMVEKKGKLASPLEPLNRILEYNGEIMRQMMENYRDSGGEILDSRIFQAQKMTMEALKTMKEFSPAAKRFEKDEEIRANLAIEIVKEQMKRQPELRARVARKILAKDS